MREILPPPAYARRSDGAVVRADGALIPPDPGNRDFAAFLAWEAAGGVAPMLPPPAAAIVAAITPRQLLLALAGLGMISEEEALAAARVGAVPAMIEGLFATLPKRDAFAARLTWARMSSVERADPLVALLGAARGMSEADLDAFFASATAL